MIINLVNNIGCLIKLLFVNHLSVEPINLLDYAKLYGLNTNLQTAIYHLERENNEKIENLITEKKEQMKSIKYLYSLAEGHHSYESEKEFTNSE